MASEAWQCPTLLLNGFGEHRIEGIGDKHVPWGHNVRDTDAVAAIDDEDCLRILRLFNEPAGREHLVARGVGEGEVEQLGWLGISSIANLLAAIKTAKYFELGEADLLLTVFTDSTDLYASRLAELREQRGGLYVERRRGRLCRPAGAPGPGRFQGADVPGAEGHSQSQILHVGRAAGENRAGTQRVMGPGVLARPFRGRSGVF